MIYSSVDSGLSVIYEVSKMTLSRNVWLVVIWWLAGSAVALSGQDYLRAFREDPRRWLDAPLVKRGSDERRVRQWPKDMSSFRLWNEQLKQTIDQRILADGKQGWKAHDRPQNLFAAGVEVETNIHKLLPQAKLSERPWSSHYWPIALGGLSARYADPSFHTLLKEEMEQFNFIRYSSVVGYYQQPAEFLSLLKFAPTKIDLYSPAEKYDLLVGDKNFSLTNIDKKYGQRWIEEDGTVADWMGICHGWAIASYASPRITRSIEVLASDGQTRIKFHADDLRALLSLKWSSSNSFPVRYIGGRCNAHDSNDEVRKDEKTGKIIDDRCFDTNPGTWHVVIANKIGRYNESFIMDATFDREVWNHPLYAYNTTFYNPITLKAGSLTDSIVPIDERWQALDPFAEVRNKDRHATQIVIVAMDVSYVVETEPRHGVPVEDLVTTVTYRYDLELDVDNKIVGGEWYTNLHPDFLWTRRGNVKPTNTVDRRVARFFPDVSSDQHNLQELDKIFGNRLTELNSLSLQTDRTPLAVVIDFLVSLASD